MKKTNNLLLILITVAIPSIQAFASDGLVINSNNASNKNCLCIVQGFGGEFNKSFEVVGTKNINFSDLNKGTENDQGLEFTGYSIIDRSCTMDKVCTPSNNQLGSVSFSVNDNNMATIINANTSPNFAVSPQAGENLNGITITYTP